MKHTRLARATGAFLLVAICVSGSPGSMPRANAPNVAASNAQQQPAVPDNVEVLRNVAFGKGGNQVLTMHIVRPRIQPKDPMPVLIYINGSAWARDNKDMAVGRLIATARQGYFGATIQVRTSGEAVFPAQLEDCKCAVRFLRAKAKEYHLDPDRIGIWGNSSGGHLSSLVGTTADVKEFDGTGGWPGFSSRVQAVCAYCPATDFLAPDWPERHCIGPNGPAFSLLGGDPRNDKRALAKSASPLTYISSTCPPFFIVHGDKDTTVPHSQGERLLDALRKAGVVASMYTVAGGDHASPHRCDQMAVEFFDKHLKGFAATAAPRAISSTAVPGRNYALQFSSYFGGSEGELLRDMTVDAQGNIYVAGVSGSANLPRSPGDIPGQTKERGAIVAKFSPAGELIWSKVIGSGKEIYFYTVEVDRAGFVYVAGRMGPGFPTTPGAFQPTTGHPCGFIGKLKPDASGWVWASYVGTGYAVRDMAMDDHGDLYGVLDFFAESKETMPTGWFANAFRKKPCGGGNHFGKCDAGLIKISGDGKVMWATWIGGTGGNDWVASLGVGADHCPVILMRTFSKDMPTTPDAANPMPSEGWLGKLSADGSKLVFGTYIADAFPRTHNVALDPQGNIFIGTCTRKWPVTPEAFQSTSGGGPEDFGVAKFSPAGKLLAATYLGGNGHEINGPDQIVVDAHGNVVIVGSSSSTDYPVTSGAFQARNAGAGGTYPYDAVVSMLSNDLRTLMYSSYMGGTGDDMARACCVGMDGILYIGGVTTSRDFPVKKPYQKEYGGDPGFGSAPNNGNFPVGWGNGDCWLAKFLLPKP